MLELIEGSIDDPNDLNIFKLEDGNGNTIHVGDVIRFRVWNGYKHFSVEGVVRFGKYHVCGDIYALGYYVKQSYKNFFTGEDESDDWNILSDEIMEGKVVDYDRVRGDDMHEDRL